MLRQVSPLISSFLLFYTLRYLHTRWIVARQASSCRNQKGYLQMPSLKVEMATCSFGPGITLANIGSGRRLYMSKIGSTTPILLYVTLSVVYFHVQLTAFQLCL